jgi:hypothetical protein
VDRRWIFVVDYGTLKINSPKQQWFVSSGKIIVPKYHRKQIIEFKGENRIWFEGKSTGLS